MGVAWLSFVKLRQEEHVPYRLVNNWSCHIRPQSHVRVSEVEQSVSHVTDSVNRGNKHAPFNFFFTSFFDETKMYITFQKDGEPPGGEVDW